MTENEKTIDKEICFVANLIRRDVGKRIQSMGMDDERFTRMNGWIIEYLYDRRDSDVYQKDIEKEMMITRSTASKIIELMVQKGMIERTEVAYDARLKKLSLTAKAMERHAKIMEIGKMTYEKAMTGFSKEEEYILRGYINRIKENMFK